MAYLLKSFSDMFFFLYYFSKVQINDFYFPYLQKQCSLMFVGCRTTIMTLISGLMKITEEKWFDETQRSTHPVDYRFDQNVLDSTSSTAMTTN